MFFLLVDRCKGGLGVFMIGEKRNVIFWRLSDYIVEESGLNGLNRE